ncbi:MAG: AMP-binding protein [Treponema sp.]|nr:AMP-binding protein [Treponema sp.]
MGKKNIFETINSIPAVLATNFQKFAKKPAMILNGEKKISYNDMRWDIFKTSNILRVGGKTPKSVAIFIDDSPQAVESFYSVLSIGSKATLLRYDMSKDEVAAALNNERPEAVFIRSAKMDLLPQDLDAIVYEIANNNVLKKSDKEEIQKRAQETIDHSKDKILAVAYSSGNKRSELTRSDLAKLIGKKDKVKKSYGSLVEYVGTLVNAFIKGRAVQASI